MRNIKVQFAELRLSTNGILNSRIPNDGDLLTFIAYSDAMKAAVLWRIAEGIKFNLSFTDERRFGEWYEPKLVDSVSV